MESDIEKVKAFLLREYHTLSTLDDVAKRLNVSPETLRKKFFRYEGIHLSEFLMIVKVERAKELLLSSSSLYCFQVSNAVGFSREDVGEHVFKRLVGVSMKEFRRRGKKQSHLGADKVNR